MALSAHNLDLMGKSYERWFKRHLCPRYTWRNISVAFAVLAQSAFKKHMCFFVLFFYQLLFYVLFCVFFWPGSAVFFPDFREITIKMVIFVHFKYFKINISELLLR